MNPDPDLAQRHTFSSLRNFLFILFCVFGFNSLALERSQFTVALDIGHSPARPGALSARGVGEYQFNQAITEVIQRRLTALGFASFILTEANPEMGLITRANQASAKHADLLLSLHHDSVQPHYLSSWFYNDERNYYSDLFSGYSVFFSGKNKQADNSKLFALLIGEKLREAGLTPTLHHAEPIEGENRPLIDADKGVYQFDGLIILKLSKIPAVLLECGIIVNRDEELRLNSPAFQETLAGAVGRAVLAYFEQTLAARCAQQPCFDK